MKIEPGKFLETILAEKAREVAAMIDERPGKLRESSKLFDVVKAHSNRLQIIAEVKKASPSLGDINMTVDIVTQAQAYEAAGAAMISVLTDPIFFKGNIEYLRKISTAVRIPTLNKDFIIDKKQINRAINAGATVILLIVACFEDGEQVVLQELYDYASSLGLEVLVETHNKAELDRAHALGAQIIGVNNRNLKTFEVSLQNSLDLVKFFKPENVYISESGIFGQSEAEKVAAGFEGILVGTALMQAADLTEKLQELQIVR